MKKWMYLVRFIPVYLLITFFGLGPVLLADGSPKERIAALAIAVVLYVVATVMLLHLMRKDRST